MKLDDSLSWPMDRAGEAMATLAKAAHLSPTAKGPTTLGVEDTARTLGLQADRLVVSFAEVEARVCNAAPALLRIGPSDAPRIIALIQSNLERARIVTPDHSVRAVSLDAVRDALFVDAEHTHGGPVDALLERIPLPPRRRALARRALLREHVGARLRDAGWTIRLSPSAPFLRQLRSAGVLRTLRAMILAHAVSLVLSLFAWWVIGQSVLAGHLDRGWLAAWALLLLTSIPIRVLTIWWQETANIGAGLLLKERILFGVLQLDPEEVRRQGMGELVGRIIEIDALEELAMRGGFVSLAAFMELAITIFVLALGPAGIASVLLFVAWLAFAGLLVRRLTVQWLAWSRARIAMTNDTVERMLGHRTRIAQEPPGDWHVEEDGALAAYSEHARRVDRTSALIAGLLPRGWLLLGLAALGPALVAQSASTKELAVGIGGVLLARNALMRMTAGLTSLVAAFAAWRQAAPLFHAAARSHPAPATDPRTTDHERIEPARADGAVLDVRHVAFRYRPHGRAALQNVTLRICHRDRVLVEGPSGGGKSTLGSLLAGLRTPESGLLLFGGLDRASWGAGSWRRRIAAAPQFHENHTLSDTFAFNLLMGRRWPPQGDDLLEAEAICRELGLGPLLGRMPGGLMQRVGETGWQLSHGERSRLYMARALLQCAEVVILDESFASLDPETKTLALRCALKRAPSLVVIAHP
ncbi:ATP-binding cassette domain-containing protein [Pendulispora albinea]|uniref:ABC transporter ATP-binding protein/permease n=1 Tax=Pendulispora albinea TaxID=2741071 RepID=A0ABZ2M447_9BACT